MEYSFKSPLVVGYKGEIGSFILQGLLRIMPKASNIWCYDINETEKERKERIKKSDIIFLCVPMQDTMKWLYKYTYLLKGKIVVEQCSLKSFIYEDKKSFISPKKNFDMYSIHILFRPSATPNKQDRKVALIQKRYGGYSFDWYKRLDLYIKKITDSEIVWFKDYKEHDQAMAVQQSLVHRILITLGKVISEGYYTHTYIGSKVIELRDRILKGDPTLYHLIQKNKHLSKVLREFKKELSDFDKPLTKRKIK